MKQTEFHDQPDVPLVINLMFLFEFRKERNEIPFCMSLYLDT